MWKDTSNVVFLQDRGDNGAQEGNMVGTRESFHVLREKLPWVLQTPLHKRVLTERAALKRWWWCPWPLPWVQSLTTFLSVLERSKKYTSDHRVFLPRRLSWRLLSEASEVFHQVLKINFKSNQIGLTHTIMIVTYMYQWVLQKNVLALYCCPIRCKWYSLRQMSQEHKGHDVTLNRHKKSEWERLGVGRTQFDYL